jgi:ubiquinone/menaquinone biosynthesis C-methylase UbiE
LTKENDMPDEKEIYNRHADQYELLVSREDYQRHILPALNRIRPFEGLDVVELGAGTGRLTCMLAPIVKTIQAFDASPHMLDVAAAKLQASGSNNWQARVADHRSLPLPDQAADVVISGWSICYTVVWHTDTWQTELGKALAEMKRVLRPGGTIIIIETLGTGKEKPEPPDNLKEYYAYLEREGFSSTWIRTDLKFESLAEAETLIRFFFGDELAQKVVEENRTVLPECTGIWWR